MKRTNYFIFLLCFALAFGLYSCQEDPFEIQPESEDAILKKGGKPADVEQGDLYGDLIEVERDDRGVPILYDLDYSVEYQDEIVEGTIDVLNPRLTGSFDLYILDKYLSELKSADPPDDEEPLPGTTEVTIEVDEDGFISNYPPAALYDGEGELLPEVANYVFPVEEGRLNLVRSPRTVLSSRMTEVIKNFGNGTVADVVRDYCGRLYMLRTQAALDDGIADKPIDSPLENLALYYELVNYGFSRSAADNGLQFLIQSDIGFNGFRFKSRLDSDWAGGAKEFGTLNGDQQKQFVANLAASCVAAASDKSNFLTFDELAYLNQFMGVPYIPNFDSSIDQLASVQCFFPVVQQQVRMINKTNKSTYSKYRYFVDYSAFSYTRNKFEETYLDLCTIVVDGDSVYKEVIVPDVPLNKILSGGFTGIVFDGYRYTDTKEIRDNAVGFANQADDYVQALEVVHNNEEFLVWQMPTPTWGNADHIDRNIISPFLFDAPEESHGNRPPGKGDDEVTTPETPTTPSTGEGRRGRR